MREVLSIIIDGGWAANMKPLTDFMPAPLIRFGSRGTLIDFALYNCLSSRLGDVVVVSSESSTQLDNYIRIYWSQAFFQTGHDVTVLPADKGRPAAAGIARRMAELLLAMERPPDHLLLLGPNHTGTADFRPLFAAHLAGRRGLTTGVISAAMHGADAVRVAGNGSVSDYCEVRAPGLSGAMSSMGVVMAARQKLLAWLADDGADSAPDLVRYFIKKAVSDKSAGAYAFTGWDESPLYWSEVRDLASFRLSQMDMLDRLSSQFRLNPIPGTGRLPYLSAEMVKEQRGKDRRVHNSMISKLARVERAVVERSVIGPGVLVEDAAVVRSSVVMDGATVRSGAVIEDSVIEPFSEVRGIDEHRIASGDWQAVTVKTMLTGQRGRAGKRKLHEKKPSQP